MVNDHPNFQLAQLVCGDLLMKRIKAVKTLGDVVPGLVLLRRSNLQELRAESRLRTSAVMQRPLAGTMPAQFCPCRPARSTRLRSTFQKRGGIFLETLAMA